MTAGSRALEHYPHVIAFDPFLNHPEGAKAIWPPLFDALCATLLLPAFWLGGLPLAEQAAALLPPAFGALCVVTTAWLGARLLGLAFRRRSSRSCS